VSRSVCLSDSNLLKANVIFAAGNDLNTLSLDSEGQAPDEYLGIGNDTRVLSEVRRRSWYKAIT